MQVPDTVNFNFKDVCDVVFGTHYYTGKNLRDAFTSAWGNFNPAYVGNKDRLSNFRGYVQNYIRFYPEDYLSFSPNYQTLTLSMDTDYPNLTCTSDHSWCSPKITSNGTILSVTCLANMGTSRFAIVTIYSNSYPVYDISIMQSA